MKILGQKLAPPVSQPFAIPRKTATGETQDIVFVCSAITDYSDFESFCPEPKPPNVRRPGKAPQPDPLDKRYLAAIDKYGESRINWLMIMSISATPDLEWEKVDKSDPDTWKLFREELLESLTQLEVNLLMSHIMDVNMPSKEAQEEALARFMSTQAQGSEVDTNSQKDEPSSTPSGELASD